MNLKNYFALLIVCVFNQGLFAQINFQQGHSFYYLKGKSADTLSVNWNTTGYNNIGWLSGNAPFYYGGKAGTLLSDMQNNYTTVYLRSSFTSTQTDKIDEIKIGVKYDDGFILWINGIEVLSRNAPSNPTYTSVAITNHDAASYEYYSIPKTEVGIIEGENSVSIMLFNRSLSSSDLYFDMSITGEVQLPLFTDTCEMKVSKKAGFYTDPFTLELSLADESKTLIYTCDGSNPQNSTTATTIKGKASVLIDPNSTTNRAKTPAVVLRVSQVMDGYKPSFAKTFTYIFYNQVKSQTEPGGDWPTGYVNDQVIDLEMDSQVTNDSRYKNSLNEALLQIPSISIVTGNENLFNSGTGIYVNAAEHGMDWERECSIELIDHSNKETGFQANAGLRIRGGLGGREGSNPKHSFRLFFREEYGQKKLKYPLFGNEGAADFDKFDLRAERNYSWSCDGSSHNTLLRDVFSRDAAGDLHQPYTRSRYYHLYLNGMYWGIYQTEERPEASYGESYLGGDDNDYDVIKVDVSDWPYVNETTDGTMDNYEKLYDFSCKSKISTADYFAIQGKDENGNKINGSKVLLNVYNLIDFMLVIFYTDNFDGPVSAWGDNNMPNNYYALYNRVLQNKGFYFVNHDAEHSMFADEVFYGSLHGNRVTLDPEMYEPSIETFQPQWLHQQLCQVAEYRTRFSDRAHEVFGSNGVFSADSCTKRLIERRDQIDMAIIAESARWGDAKTTQALTKDDDWIPEVNTILDDFIPYRTSIVVDQLKKANLYSTLSEPTYAIGGNSIYKEYKMSESSVTLEVKSANNKGTVYYTTNGSDPRRIGGSVSANAINLGQSGSINIKGTTTIEARVLDGTNWGPLSSISILKQNEDYSNFKITEIHYHPANVIQGTDTIDGKDLEFIEFKNTGTTAINISGVTVDSAVYFQFPANTILNGGEFFVISAKPNKFYQVQQMEPSGNFSGNLSNSGEQINVFNPNGNLILACYYNDNNPWPNRPDGEGYTLSAASAYHFGDPNDASYWITSSTLNGSPFADDAALVINESGINQLNDITVYPNPTNGIIYIEGLKAIHHIISVTITDVTGRSLFDAFIDPSQSFSFDFNELGKANGVYALLLHDGNQAKAFKILFIQ
jgi:hypothetical protein